MEYYKVTINPKEGKRENPWHATIREGVCGNIKATAGCPAHFDVFTGDGEWHYGMITSTVIDKSVSVDGVVKIETKNTYYTFEPTEIESEAASKTVHGVEAKI